jgi:hypothetical protein
MYSYTLYNLHFFSHFFSQLNLHNIMAYQPKDYAGRIGLAQKVISAWRENHPQQQFSICNISDLELMTAELSANYSARNTDSSKLTVNSSKLVKLNKKINASVTVLKNYLKDEYGEDSESYYTSYGLVLDTRGNYCLPIDNDNRNIKINELVAKLSQAGDPIANNKKGLAHWDAIKLEHNLLWSKSSTLRSSRSLNVGKAQQLHNKVGKILSKIAAMLKLESTKEELPSKLRSFGFHSETFK